MCQKSERVMRITITLFEKVIEHPRPGPARPGAGLLVDRSNVKRLQSNLVTWVWWATISIF